LAFQILQIGVTSYYLLNLKMDDMKNWLSTWNWKVWLMSCRDCYNQHLQNKKYFCMILVAALWQWVAAYRI